MKLTNQIAQDLRKTYHGGNWTGVSLKDQIADVTWEEALKEVNGFNTIAILVYHINYYIKTNIKVLKGGPLEGKDIYSFTHPPIESANEWKAFMVGIWAEVEEIALLIEAMPEEKLWEDFTDPKYGNYYRNLNGIVEHCHYHIGQITLIKKIIRAVEAKS